MHALIPLSFSFVNIVYSLCLQGVLTYLPWMKNRFYFYIHYYKDNECKKEKKKNEVNK